MRGANLLHTDRHAPERRVALPEAVLGRLRLRLLGECGGCRVYGVDGAAVRGFDVDFVDGGNAARYVYVPEDEVWVEQQLAANLADLAATVLHEAIECDAMRQAGADYATAHDAANVMEQLLRAAFAGGAIEVATTDEAVAVAQDWFMRAHRAARALVAALADPRLPGG